MVVLDALPAYRPASGPANCAASNPAFRPAYVDADGLFLGNRFRLTAAIEAAVAANAVWRLGLVTLRAFAEADGLQGVTSAAFRGAGFRVSSLWIRHRLKTLSSVL